MSWSLHSDSLVPDLIPVGEPAPGRSGLVGFFRCLGTTEVVPNHLASKERKLLSFHRQINTRYADHVT